MKLWVHYILNVLVFVLDKIYVKCVTVHAVGEVGVVGFVGAVISQMCDAICAALNSPI